jgi:hypothetical protein
MKMQELIEMPLFHTALLHVPGVGRLTAERRDANGPLRAAATPWLMQA